MEIRREMKIYAPVLLRLLYTRTLYARVYIPLLSLPRCYFLMNVFSLQNSLIWWLSLALYICYTKKAKQKLLPVILYYMHNLNLSHILFLKYLTYSLHVRNKIYISRKNIISVCLDKIAKFYRG